MTKSLAERFEEKTCPEPNTGCLLWTGAREMPSVGGYGVIHAGGPVHRTLKAHRVAWFLAFERWPEPHALHRCDTPLCVNVAHLFEGTQADNIRDMVAKGRQGTARGRPKPQCIRCRRAPTWCRCWT